MTRFELKTHIKTLSKAIRQLKLERKSVHYTGERLFFPGSDAFKALGLSATYSCASSKAQFAREVADYLHSKLRILHAAIGLIRGRKMEEIEKKVREGNAIDMNAVNAIVKQTFEDEVKQATAEEAAI